MKFVSTRLNCLICWLDNQNNTLPLLVNAYLFKTRAFTLLTIDLRQRGKWQNNLRSLWVKGSSYQPSECRLKFSFLKWLSSLRALHLVAKYFNKDSVFFYFFAFQHTNINFNFQNARKKSLRFIIFEFSSSQLMHFKIEHSLLWTSWKIQLQKIRDWTADLLNASPIYINIHIY